MVTPNMIILRVLLSISADMEVATLFIQERGSIETAMHLINIVRYCSIVVLKVLQFFPISFS